MIGGITRHYHAHGISQKAWMSMGPIARKLTTTWQDGITVGEAVSGRPNLIHKIEGKAIDNGWNWGIPKNMHESDIAPLIEI